MLSSLYNKWSNLERDRIIPYDMEMELIK